MNYSRQNKVSFRVIALRQICRMSTHSILFDEHLVIDEMTIVGIEMVKLKVMS